MRVIKIRLVTRLILAAVALNLSVANLTPVYAAGKEDARVVKAKKDLKAMKSALDRFMADTVTWPNRVDGSNPATNTVQVLYSEGNAIAAPTTWPVDVPEVYKQMSSYFADGNDRNYPKWKGPYLSVNADPWGNTYLIGVKNGEKKDLPVWILSAGPDGILQTPIDSPVCMDGKSKDPVTGKVAAGDDLCLKYK